MEINEIKEGIKHSMARGDSMGQAMQTFFNSGYSKEEVEAAAKEIQMEKFSNITQPNFVQPKAKIESVQNNIQITSVPKQTMKPSYEQNFNMLKIPESSPASVQQTVQKISSYGVTKKPKNLIAIISLSIALLMLLLLFVGVIIFNKDIISFFQGLTN